MKLSVRAFNALAHLWGYLIWVWRGRPRWKQLKRKRCPVCGRRLRLIIAKREQSRVLGCCDRCHTEYARRLRARGPLYPL